MKYGKNNHIELNGIENTRGSSAVRSFLFYLNMNLTPKGLHLNRMPRNCVA